MEGFIVGWWQFMRELFLFLGKPKVFYYILYFPNFQFGCTYGYPYVRPHMAEIRFWGVKYLHQ